MLVPIHATKVVELPDAGTHAATITAIDHKGNTRTKHGFNTIVWRIDDQKSTDGGDHGFCSWTRAVE